MHAPGATPRMLLATTALAMLLAGCGGSGSSGFDPTFAEGLVIQQALEEERCVGYRDLTICPSGAAAPNPGSGVPGAPDFSVEARVDRADLLGCGAGGGLGACTLGVTVVAAGLGPEAELRLAVRLLPDGAWDLGAPLEVPAGAGPAVVPGTLEAQPLDGLVEGVQVAVLVFAVPPRALPAEVEELAGTGAAWAFVLPEIPLGR